MGTNECRPTTEEARLYPGRPDWIVDEVGEVCVAWLGRMDWGPPTEVEIAISVSHPDWNVRAALARRADFVPSPALLERGLADSFEGVRHAWAERLKMMAQEAQDDLLELDQPEA